MSDSATKTVRVRRPTTVSVDDRGQSVGNDTVVTAELELVSTQMLKVMLSSRDETERKAIEDAAKTATEGVLARDPVNGGFEIIEDNELQAILDDNQGLPKISRPADATSKPLNDYADDEQLSLVSTQALRKVLSPDAEEEQDAVDLEPSNFDPYNSG